MPASKFTAARAAQVVAHVRGGLFRYVAAELVGVSERTLDNWTAKGKDNLLAIDREADDPDHEGPRTRVDRFGRFLGDMLAAEAEAEARVLGVVHELATDCSDPAVKLRAATWYLERKKALRYGRAALRVDIGTGAPGDGEDVIDVVLGKLSQIERRTTPNGSSETH